MKIFSAPLLLSLLTGSFVDGAGKNPDNAVGALISMSNGYLTPDVFNPNELVPLFLENYRPNDLVMYHRFEDGTYSIQGKFPTGGDGFGPAVVTNSIISVGSNVFVCNMLSNTVTMFEINRFGAVRLDTVTSGGSTPSSLAYRDGILYVFNAAYDVPSNAIFAKGTPSITAFEVHDGSMTPIPKFTRTLTDWTDEGGAEIEITPDGRFLLAGIAGIADETFETFNSALLVYRLNDAGRPSAEPVEVLQEGLDYFSAAVIDEYEGKTFLYAANLIGGTVSSYRLRNGGQIVPITPPVQGPSIGSDAAVCWVERYGNYLYTSNFSDNTITSFLIDRSTGSVTLLEEIAFDVSAVSGAFGALDILIVDNYLYYVDGQATALIGFEIGDDGSLTVLTDAEGAPLVEIGATTGLAYVEF
uniref:Uncharacterized protein n=1 Tax=Ditylum brightwellii TaxID=49249 RepID=A0A7S4QD41_9STRA